MHILHMAGALKGGPLTAIADWTRAQVAAGHRVSLVYSPLRDPINSFRNVLSPSIELYPVDMGREISIFHDLRANQKFLTLVKDLDPDILHLHSSKAGAIGRFAGWVAGIPTIYSPHGISFLRTDVGLSKRLVYFLLEWAFACVGTMTVACSQSELNEMRNLPGRKSVIPNGIELKSVGCVSLPKVNGPNLDIVLCGRITAQKNPALACSIASLSPESWRWSWLGDGELRHLVEQSGRIEVLGWRPRDDLLRRLGSADVFVHTSKWEGMPIAVLEAMALRLPVVATNVAGNRDLVANGLTGFLADSSEEFLTVLTRLATSPELRVAMGLAGHNRVAAEFDQGVLVTRWLALYQDIMSESRSGNNTRSLGL